MTSDVNQDTSVADLYDVIPWQSTDLLAHITAESPTPILTGEDIYLKEVFINLYRKHAVCKIHPDISTSEGLWRGTKTARP